MISYAIVNVRYLRLQAFDDPVYVLTGARLILQPIEAIGLETRPQENRSTSLLGEFDIDDSQKSVHCIQNHINNGPSYNGDLSVI